ncbi:MAG: class I SAM-dependent methyltransferase [Sedimentisphaerales bacterium]|nr:class I SAM-dependent methyltransferase [Sedimentisphaerales bacterium]
MIDYRDSHTHVNKGCQYDRRFIEFKWRKYLWEREQLALDKILQKYFGNRSIRYLDFACGTGRILQFMKKRVDSCTGIDVSESMLKECLRKLPDIEIIHADITRDDVLGGRVFDLITAFRFFPNAQDSLRSEAIEVLSKHLSPGGILVFNNHRNTSSFLYTLARMLKNDIRTMSNSEIDNLAASVNLEIVETFSIGVLPGYDNHPMIAPSFVHKCADSFANACGLGKTLCQDIIYVCRENSAE